ncbi:MAG: hypothetical protein IT178_11850, partial [Acidobacteria bacterium]|nr:hypothetical protein [Acidobacteriota bacterium]
MSELRPWSNFEHLVDELASLQRLARDAAARSVDEVLTLRSWLIGAWIIAFEQDGADRARYGEGLLAALAQEFNRRGVTGLGARNLKNYRQLTLTWPRLGILQTASALSALGLPDVVRQPASGESAPEHASIRQTLSAELLPALPAGTQPLP